MRLWFKCAHKKLSAPVIRPRNGDSINRLEDCYVTCLNCGQRLPFSTSAGCVVEERRQPSDAGLTPVESHAAVGRTIPAQADAPAAADKQEDLWGHTGAKLARASRGVAAERPSDTAGMQAPSPSGSAISLAGLHKLALAYHTQGKYDQAERIYGEALAHLSSAEQQRSPEYSQLLNNVGRL